MTVYVDDMYKVPMGQFRRMKMSHMMANTDDELHAMADRIGVQRQWFQGDHYDISITKRNIAIKCGAVEVSMRQLAAFSRMKLIGWWQCTPSEAAIIRYGRDYPLSEDQ